VTVEPWIRPPRLGLKPTLLYTSPRIRTFVACDLILYLLLLKEKEDDYESCGP